jgi:hypothetical protein
MTRTIVNTKTKLFLVIGIIGITAVLIGFSTTFIIPLSNGTFKAPLIIYIHGFLAFNWTILFLIQSILVQRNNYSAHRLFGIYGVILAIAITITIVPAGLYQAEKELAQGLGQTAISSILGTLTSGLIFIGLVIAGILKRHKSSTHKRLMLLATIVLLWPAWFRFRHLFPSVSNPEIWFAIVLADSLIVISMMWDKITLGKIDPTLLYTGLSIIIEHIVEAYMFDKTLWRELANTIYGLLT